MKVQRFILAPWDWECMVFYDTTPHVASFILGLLEDMGCNPHTARRAARNLMSGQKDTGLTFSSPRARSSVVVIGRTSDRAQFWNTLDHEKGHLTEHVAAACDLDRQGEEFQYLRGLIAEKMYPEAINFLCACGKDFTL